MPPENTGGWSGLTVGIMWGIPIAIGLWFVDTIGLNSDECTRAALIVLLCIAVLQGSMWFMAFIWLRSALKHWTAQLFFMLALVIGMSVLPALAELIFMLYRIVRAAEDMSWGYYAFFVGVAIAAAAATQANQKALARMNWD